MSNESQATPSTQRYGDPRDMGTPRDMGPPAIWGPPSQNSIPSPSPGPWGPHNPSAMGAPHPHIPSDLGMGGPKYVGALSRKKWTPRKMIPPPKKLYNIWTPSPNIL
jgi:hypothetical protein